MKKILIVLLILVVCNCKKEVISPPPEINPPSFESSVSSLATNYALPSFSAVIISRDSILWNYSYGFADVEMGIGAHKETIYSTASVSKLVTATAVMQQVEQGRIDLDEDINTYLDFEVRSPHFPEVPITARMLLTHRSGMSSPYDMDDPNFFIPFEEESAPELGTWLKSYLSRSVAWMSHAPGSEEQYSNHGVALLGYIVERINGIDFRRYCREHIFLPLEMENTSFDLNDLDSSKLAVIYHGARHFQYSVPYYPATSLKTSLVDFSKFMSMYLNEGSYKGIEILKPETVTDMLKIKNAGSSLGYLWWSYAQGWNGHAGAYYGATSFMDIHRGKGLGVFLVSNKSQWLIRESNLLWPGGKMHDLIHRHAETLR